MANVATNKIFSRVIFSPGMSSAFSPFSYDLNHVGLEFHKVILSTCNVLECTCACIVCYEPMTK